MDSNTKEDLKEFIRSVIDLACAIYSFADTDSVETVINKGTQLMDQLDKDETII